MSEQQTGKLIIISGPSGAGKSTVVRELLQQCPLPLVVSVSATTRQPRAGEQDGIDYHFLTSEQFEARRQAEEFLECMEVFDCGDWYGTLESEVTSGLTRGQWVILEIDVEGTQAVLKKNPNTITFFVHPGSTEELERRLRGRASDSEQAVKRRLEVAKRELELIDNYQHEIINDQVNRAVQEICDLLTQAGDLDAR